MHRNPKKLVALDRRSAHGEHGHQGELYADYYQAFHSREHSTGRVESHQRKQRRGRHADNLDRSDGQTICTLFNQFRYVDDAAEARDMKNPGFRPEIRAWLRSEQFHARHLARLSHVIDLRDDIDRMGHAYGSAYRSHLACGSANHQCGGDPTSAPVR